jgi:hypothetical protein
MPPLLLPLFIHLFPFSSWQTPPQLRQLRLPSYFLTQFPFSWDDLKVFERAKKNGALAIRIYAAVPLFTWKLLADFIAQNQANGDSLFYQ